MSSADSVSASGKTIQLHDGRTLGYADYGSSARKALFYFHGAPGTRVEARDFAKQTVQAGVRLIAVDRPGMGLSSFKARRRLLDWPDDVVELANYLHIDRFAVIGVSGGGPYALACAYKIPDCLTACGIVSGLGPLVEVGTAGMSAGTRRRFFLARWLPWLALPQMWWLGHFFQNEEQARKLIVRSARTVVEPDRKCALMPEVAGTLAASFVEAFRQGAKGPAYEDRLYACSWGFKLEDITFPRLYLWHGELDRNAPLAMAQAVAERLAHCKATYYPDEGHISVFVNHREEMLMTLIS